MPTSFPGNTKMKEWDVYGFLLSWEVIKWDIDHQLQITRVEQYVNSSQIGLFADDVILCCNDANISKMESQLTSAYNSNNAIDQSQAVITFQRHY
ncbi:hypothetical protein TNIN_29041 [Trichonephila inaurata madagascariensis]|uniref:Uncharacterized protein n=1 Tax=Trichonephila inaurata madagascariensis TaxID=2747483 RepID=A0A8X6WUD1_9ARAC|nr:hypothetical protein TNIN_29041 [Trichonephila inaurata madagascariensis]